MSKGKQSAVCLQTAVLVKDVASVVYVNVLFCTGMNQGGSEGQAAGTGAYG